MRPFHSHLQQKITLCDHETIFRRTCVTDLIEAKNYNSQTPFFIRALRINSDVSHCDWLLLILVNQGSRAKKFNLRQLQHWIKIILLCWDEEHHILLQEFFLKGQKKDKASKKLVLMFLVKNKKYQ